MLYSYCLTKSQRSFAVYYCSLEDMRKKDEEKGLLEKSKNEIEAFVFDFQDKLAQKAYKLCSTEEERIGIIDRLNTVSDWLSEQDDATPRKVSIF